MEALKRENRELKAKYDDLQIQYNRVYNERTDLQLQLNRYLGELKQTQSIEIEKQNVQLKLKDLQNNEERMREYVSQLVKDKQVAEMETAQFRNDVAYLTQEADRLLKDSHEQHALRQHAQEELQRTQQMLLQV